MSSIQSSDSSVETMEATSLTDTILNIIPDNPINSGKRNHALQLSCICPDRGWILAKMGERAETVANFFSQFNDIMMEMTMMIMALCTDRCILPISRTFANIGFSAFIPLAKYMIGVLPLHWRSSASAYTRSSLKIFHRTESDKIHQEIFPRLWHLHSQQLHPMPRSRCPLIPCPKSGCFQEDFFIQYSSWSYHQHGRYLYHAGCRSICGTGFGIHLSPMDYVTVIGTATLASGRNCRCTCVGLVTLTMVFNSVGLPVEAIGLIMGVLTVSWI